MKRRTALGLLVLAVAALCAPLLLRGAVIFPHDNSEELNVRDAPPDAERWNRKFSDTSSYYLPEIAEHLRSDHAGWLATWNPSVEVGRPLSHISGFSPAFLPTRVLSWLTRDALVLNTWLTLLTLLGAAVFGFLFLEELGTRPAAALAGTLALSLGVYSIYWATCVLFVAGWCWALCALWGIARYARRPGAGSFAWIVFGVHALLITGYPQQVVWHLYVIVPLAIAAAWRAPAPQRARRLLALAAAGALGIAAAAPVLLDLLVATSRSTRIGADHVFFRQTLHGITGTREPWLFLAQLFDPYWFGDPIHPERPYSGIALSPLWLAAVAAAPLVLPLRRVGPWLAFFAVGVAAAFSEGFYLFGVDWLGWSLSRYPPMAGALLPCAVLLALVADRVLREEIPRRWPVVLAALVPLAIAAARGASGPEPVEAGAVAISCVFLLGFLALLWTRSALLLVLLSLLGAWRYGAPLWLARPPDTIHLTSPSVEAARAHLPPGARYAGIGDVVSRYLPPNEESLLGLRSIHSYNSLSSRAYQEWTTRVSPIGTRTYGRQFRKITSDEKLADAELTWSGIGLYVAERTVENAAVEWLATVDEVGLFRPRAAPILEAQLTAFDRPAPGEAAAAGRLHDLPRLPVRRAAAWTDRLRFETTPHGSPTLLFVSQQHHPDWRATSAAGELESAVVNGFYQGVVLPPGTSEVVLEFRPWARWAWLPQLGFALALAVLLARRWLGRGSGPAQQELVRG